MNYMVLQAPISIIVGPATEVLDDKTVTLTREFRSHYRHIVQLGTLVKSINHETNPEPGPWIWYVDIMKSSHIFQYAVMKIWNPEQAESSTAAKGVGGISNSTRTSHPRTTTPGSARTPMRKRAGATRRGTPLRLKPTPAGATTSAGNTETASSLRTRSSATDKRAKDVQDAPVSVGRESGRWATTVATQGQGLSSQSNQATGEFCFADVVLGIMRKFILAHTMNMHACYVYIYRESIIQNQQPIREWH